MDGSLRKWLACLLLHLDHHRGNLAAEARPDEQTSVDQQAAAIKKGLDRFKSSLVDPDMEPVEVRHAMDWFEKIDELLMEKAGLSPRHLLEKLVEMIKDLVEMVMRVLRACADARC